MTARIYKIPLPEATTRDEREGLGTKLVEKGVLDGDALVNQLSSQAADLTLTGRYAYGRYFSELVATELEELADASFSGVALYGGSPSREGYYEVESATVEPVHAGGRDVWEWTLSLTRVGTRKSQLQALETAPSQPSPGHSFGNDTDGLVGVPAAARTVRAIDSLSAPTTRLRPTPTTTVTTEYGDVDLFDATALSIDEPVYLYDIAKGDQPPVDARVYDTNGRDSKFIEGSNGRVRAWQAVFARSHEFAGGVVMSNGRLRLTLTEIDGSDPGSFDAEEYASGSWSAVALPDYSADLDTDWQPADVDLTRIGEARIAAQVEFEAVAGTNAGDIHAVNMQLDRGRGEAFVTETSDGQLPTDLESLLAPVADTSVVDPGVVQSLADREEVRR